MFKVFLGISLVKHIFFDVYIGVNCTNFRILKLKLLSHCHHSHKFNDPEMRHKIGISSKVAQECGRMKHLNVEHTPI